MQSDVTLKDETVVVQGDLEVGQINAVGNQLKIKGSDLLLNAPERRALNSDPNVPRRALVHDAGDKLTLNYGTDYPGGVKINGRTEADKLAVNSIISATENNLVNFDSEILARKRISVANGIYIEPDASQPLAGEILVISQHTIQLKSYDIRLRQTKVILDLVEEIKKLRQDLNDLKDKVDHHISR